ncbi:MAG: C-type lectin-like protein [uncultured bacterium (gcode 4)]|uniref:C-type lectin-like protein n=1 Tax=uncultured bacterium (gcode 4) TaxID=1234023 RepID=K2FZ61_9BACT|nr:MAG: C-type lectin-like protein [uncultured bacterium (gcode 4)]
MSFFVTSVGLGNGANLGGLNGADEQCQKLAESVNAGNLTWRAYLSTQGTGSVSARDRIWNGPWYNAKGELIANNVGDLHSNNNNISKQTALTEKGEVVNGRGDTPNMHDILTWSQPDGTAFTGAEDRTCWNWTKNWTGSAMLWHSDRVWLDESDAAKSWNSSHLSRWPQWWCSQDDLKSTGWDGLFYCFAID